MEDCLVQIKNNIKQAAKKADRKEEDITLIAVSKTYPISKIQEAIRLGCTDFGENRVQELTQKMESIQGPVNWHLIGHLQTNKVKYIIGKTKLIHSVDSMKLALELEKQSQKQDCISSILLEVNVGEEASKNGIIIEEAMNYVKQIAHLSHVRLKGLMTVAPYVDDPEKNRSLFRQLYDLSVDIQKQKLNNIDMKVLSMGMSNDYAVAIEEGATMVRIGTAIFGTRDYR